MENNVPELNEYIRISLTKINSLIERDDFVRIKHIDMDWVILEFENEECTVSPRGRVDWRRDNVL